MTAPYPRPFTYEECVKEVATTLEEIRLMVPRSAIAAAAHALSLAFNVQVREVHAALMAEMDRQTRQTKSSE